MDNVGNTGENNDAEKALDRHIEELEAARAKEIDAAVAAKKSQDDEERRQRQVASLAAIVKQTGILVFMTDSALADALDKNGFEHSEEGLRQLIGKYPHIVDHRIGKRFLSGVKDAPERPEKPLTRADFPNSHSEFKSIEQRIQFVDQFGLDAWEAMPSKPRASATPLSKMTWEDWRSLSYAEKSQHINTLTEMGRDAEEFISRLPRKQQNS